MKTIKTGKILITAILAAAAVLLLASPVFAKSALDEILSYRIHVSLREDASCDMEIRQIKGMKNIFLGGEGLFNTVVRGPGHIISQSMPVSRTAMMLYGYMPHSSS